MRWILGVEPSGAWAGADERRCDSWARHAAELQGVVGAEFELVDRDAHAAHTGRPDQPRFAALLSLWSDGALDIAAVARSGSEAGVGRVAPFAVEQCAVRLDFPRDWPDGEPTPGLKKSTFWAANPDVGPAWRERYERHAAIVRDHHSSAWRYRQNVLCAHDDPGGWQAVSELWWPDREGLLERFYNSPESQQAVREDTVFVGRAMPIVTTHTILRTAPGEARGSEA